jgi:hypothetical protein
MIDPRCLGGEVTEDKAGWARAWPVFLMGGDKKPQTYGGLGANKPKVCGLVYVGFYVGAI